MHVSYENIAIFAESPKRLKIDV